MHSLEGGLSSFMMEFHNNLVTLCYGKRKKEKQYIIKGEVTLWLSLSYKIACALQRLGSAVHMQADQSSPTA